MNVAKVRAPHKAPVRPPDATHKDGTGMFWRLTNTRTDRWIPPRKGRIVTGWIPAGALLTQAVRYPWNDSLTEVDE